MKNIELYLTMMNPNGTNDLVVVDGNSGEVLECVEEVTFGYSRQTRIEFDAVLYHGEFVGSMPETGDVLGDDDTELYKVDLNVLKKYHCVGPSDPYGSDLVRRLLKAGIDLYRV